MHIWIGLGRDLHQIVWPPHQERNEVGQDLTTHKSDQSGKWMWIVARKNDVIDIY